MTSNAMDIQPALDVERISIEEWLAIEPKVEIRMRRKSDGLRITFCPTPESKADALARGEVAFNPSEVRRLGELASMAGDDGESGGEEARALAAKVVDAKRVFPGIRLGEVVDLRGESC